MRPLSASSVEKSSSIESSSSAARLFHEVPLYGASVVRCFVPGQLEPAHRGDKRRHQRPAAPQREAGAVRQMDIGEQNVEIFVAQPARGGFQVGGNSDAMAMVFQVRAQLVGEGLAVLHHQDGEWCSSPGSGDSRSRHEQGLSGRIDLGGNQGLPRWFPAGVVEKGESLIGSLSIVRPHSLNRRAAGGQSGSLTWPKSIPSAFRLR